MADLPDSAERPIHADRDAFVAGRDIYVDFRQTPEQAQREQLYTRDHPVFVQYLNPEVLACYGFKLRSKDNKWLLAHAIQATKLALLATERNLIMPASYLYEVPNMELFLGEVLPLVYAGVLKQTSPFADVEEYRESKIVEYRKDPENPYARGSSGQHSQDLLWAPRLRSITATDISTVWHNELLPGGTLAIVEQSLSKRWTGGLDSLEQSLHDVPNRLEGQAFIDRFVRASLQVTFQAPERNLLGMFLSRAYIESYLADLDAVILTDFELAPLSCGIESTNGGSRNRVVSAARLLRLLGWVGIRSYILGQATWEELLTLREDPGLGMLATRIEAVAGIEPLRRAVVRLRTGNRYGLEADSLDEVTRRIYNVANLLN